MDVDARSSREEEAGEEVASRRIARARTSREVRASGRASRCDAIAFKSRRDSSRGRRARVVMRRARAMAMVMTMVFVCGGVETRARASACRETATRVDPEHGGEATCAWLVGVALRDDAERPMVQQ